jgi:hypothetical protein
MKKLDIFKKVKEIKQLVDDRNMYEGTDSDDLLLQYDVILLRIREIANEVIGKDK